MAASRSARTLEFRQRELQAGNNWSQLMDLAMELRQADRPNWSRRIMRRAFRVSADPWDKLASAYALVRWGERETGLRLLERATTRCQSPRDKRLLGAHAALWGDAEQRQKLLPALGEDAVQGCWSNSPAALAMDRRVGQVLSVLGQDRAAVRTPNRDSIAPAVIANSVRQLPIAVCCRRLHDNTLAELTAYIRRPDRSNDALGWVVAHHYSCTPGARPVHDFIVLHIGQRCTAVRARDYNNTAIGCGVQHLDLVREYGTFVPRGDINDRGTVALTDEQAITFSQMEYALAWDWVCYDSSGHFRLFKENAEEVGNAGGFACTANCDMGYIAMLSSIWSSPNSYRWDAQDGWQWTR